MIFHFIQLYKKFIPGFYAIANDFFRLNFFIKFAKLLDKYCEKCFFVKSVCEKLHILMAD